MLTAPFELIRNPSPKRSGESWDSYFKRAHDMYQSCIQAQKSRFYNRVPTPSDSDDDDDDAEEEDEMKDGDDNTSETLRWWHVGLAPDNPDLVYYGIEPEPKPVAGHLQESEPWPQCYLDHEACRTRRYEGNAGGNGHDQCSETDGKDAQREVKRGRTTRRRQTPVDQPGQDQRRCSHGTADGSLGKRSREEEDGHTHSTKRRKTTTPATASSRPKQQQPKRRSVRSKQDEASVAPSRRKRSREDETNDNAKRRKTTSEPDNLPSPVSEPARRSPRFSTSSSNTMPTTRKRSREFDEDEPVDDVKRRKTTTTTSRPVHQPRQRGSTRLPPRRRLVQLPTPQATPVLVPHHSAVSPVANKRQTRSTKPATLMELDSNGKSLVHVPQIRHDVLAGVVCDAENPLENDQKEPETSHKRKKAHGSGTASSGKKSAGVQQAKKNTRTTAKR